MKWSKNLISLSVAVIFGLSLILVPAVSQPVQAAVTWTYPNAVTLQGATYVEDAWVIYDSDESIYRMWYSHGKTDLTVTEIVSSMTTSLGLSPIISDIASLALVSFLGHLGSVNITEARNLLDGTSTVIGYATSSNRVTWTVQDSEVLAGSGEAWNSVGAPCVIKVSDNDYRMWYTRVETDLNLTDLQTILTNLGTAGQRKDALLDLINSTRTVIGYATSDDGITWTARDSPVLFGSGSAWDSVADPCVVKVSDNDYRMWYTQGKTDVTQATLDAMDAATFGIDEILEILDGTSTVIGYTTSSDGIDWGATEEVLAGDGSAWNSIANPSVVKSSSYEMWYTQGRTNLTQAGLGTLLDEIAGPEGLAESFWDILEDFGTGDFEQLLNNLSTLEDDISTIEDLLGNTRTVIGYASSSDGEDWNVVNAQHLVGSSTSAWSSVAAPSVVKSGTTYYMWYTEGIDDLTVLNLVALVLGTDLPIGYAYYIYTPPVVPPVVVDMSPPVVVPPPTVEELEAMVPTEAAEIIEAMATGAAADIIEGMATEAAADIIEEIATGKAADIIEEVATGKAADIIEEVATEKAADIIEAVATEKAADILEEVVTEKAADIIEEVATPKAADILEKVAVKEAAAIMEEVTTDKLTAIVPRMSEESLTERLPELTADKLHEIPPAVLFDALPNAPTEQLVDEVPPVPPPDLPAPIVVYETPTGVRYMAMRTAAGEWVTIIGSPIPVDKLMIKVTESLEKIEATVEEVVAPPEAAKLPSDVSVASFLEITLENITPGQVVAGHIRFKVENTWIEKNSINKWSVFLNRYDKEAGKWIKLPTTKKEEDKDYVYYHAAIHAFSLFAITGSSTVPPLEFRASNLAFNPSKVRAGESVTITADIKNELGVTDKYAASLWINSTVEDVKYLTLAKGETTTVSFDVTKDKVGSYQVRIGRQMGSFEVLPPIVVPKPAAFELSQLSIAPAEVKIEEKVTISAIVTNIGEVEGSYEAVLKIDGVSVATATVTLGAGKSIKVVFSVTRDVAATYQVEVDGQVGQFTVTPVPVVPPPPPFPWWWIVAGVVVVGLLVYFLVIRRRTA